jgi:hypothetical protein
LINISYKPSYSLINETFKFEKKGRKKGKPIVERVSFAREKVKHSNRGRKRQLAAARSQKKVKKETNGVATSSQSEDISRDGSSNISERGHGYNDEKEISLQRFSREAIFDVDYATAKQHKDFGGSRLL